jgi:hypothetical protein
MLALLHATVTTISSGYGSGGGGFRLSPWVYGGVPAGATAGGVAAFAVKQSQATRQVQAAARQAQLAAELAKEAPHLLHLGHLAAEALEHRKGE